jgi:hypothetical protein
MVLLGTAPATSWGRGADSALAAPTRAATTNARCPSVVVAENGTASGKAVASVLRRRNRVFPHTDTHGADVFAVAALDAANGGAAGIDLRRYTAAAKRACGARVARHSWAVFVHLPAAPMASTADAAVFTARTERQWRPWYIVYPAFGTSGFIDTR